MKTNEAQLPINLLHKKNREQLLDEYKSIKAPPYFRIFSMPLLILTAAIIGMYYPDNKQYALTILFMLYAFIEWTLFMTITNRKLEKLYEIEKNRES